MGIESTPTHTNINHYNNNNNNNKLLSFFFLLLSRFLLIDINVTVINGMIKKYVGFDLYLEIHNKSREKRFNSNFKSCQ